jgi:hypothetical protein
VTDNEARINDTNDTARKVVAAAEAFLQTVQEDSANPYYWQLYRAVQDHKTAEHRALKAATL